MKKNDENKKYQIDPEQDANAVLDELWSAQYLAPGTLCAFAGETTTTTTTAADSSPSSSSSSFTHALHMRFPNPRAAAAFVAHPAFSAARERAEAAAAAAGASNSSGSNSSDCSDSDGNKNNPVVVVAFEGRVDPPSLETLFRRGAEWESGVEHVMILSSCSNAEGGGAGGGAGGGEAEEEAAAAAAADKFVSQLRELAESSLAGAVQSTAGRVFSVGGEDPPAAAAAAAADGSLPAPPLRPTHAVLTRFAAEEQLRAFLALPPVTALFQPPPPTTTAATTTEKEADVDVPLRAVAWAQYSIAPPQGVTGKQGA